MAGLRDLHTTTAGQQVLTVFRSERMEERTPSVLQNAMDLLAEHRRLCPPTGKAGGLQSALTRHSKGRAP